MRIYDIEEHGFDRAMRGLARSYGQTAKRMLDVAKRLGPLDKGHNKFLESIVVWVEIDAPRFWWSEFDTYRVGMTKQSDSTMHTLKKSTLTQENFEHEIKASYLLHINGMIIDDEPIEKIKNDLPDGFIQGRSLCTNYKTIRHIIVQRHNHRLPQWRQFCEAMKALEHYEYLGLDLKSEGGA